MKMVGGNDATRGQIGAKIPHSTVPPLTRTAADQNSFKPDLDSSVTLRP